jgi:hypothetical protein
MKGGDNVSAFHLLHFFTLLWIAVLPVRWLCGAGRMQKAFWTASCPSRADMQVRFLPDDGFRHQYEGSTPANDAV